MAGKKGIYQIKNREKYINPNVTQLLFRSKWELKFMLYLDSQPLVTKWGYEVIKIKYLFSLDNKYHTYYPDFYVEIGDKKYIIEVKPKHESVTPKKLNQNMKNYTYQVLTFIKNKDKWAAAKNFCDSKNIIFKILTEDELNIK